MNTYKLSCQTIKHSLLAGLSVFAVNQVMAADLSIVSWGGSYQEAQDKALFQPAAEALGIEIAQDSYGGLSDLRLKVNSNSVEWDLIVTGAGGGARAGAEGLLEPLDYDIIDVSDFIPGFAQEYCVGSDVFGTNFAWNTDTYGDAGPQSWAEFFDVDKFPGSRAYRAKSHGALEPALLADGVPKEKVYETLATDEGLEQALNKIRSIKEHIAVWWTSGAQQAQLMKDGEVDMSTGWNGRFDNAIKDGAKANYSFNGGLMDVDCFGIPKGAPNKDLAMKFLAEISKAEYQVNLPKYITYGPANQKAYELGLIDEETLKKLPSSPENSQGALVVDTQWYAEHEQRIEEAYQEMLTE